MSYTDWDNISRYFDEISVNNHFQKSEIPFANKERTKNINWTKIIPRWMWIRILLFKHHFTHGFYSEITFTTFMFNSWLRARIDLRGWTFSFKDLFGFVSSYIYRLNFGQKCYIAELWKLWKISKHKHFWYQPLAHTLIYYFHIIYGIQTNKLYCIY